MKAVCASRDSDHVGLTGTVGAGGGPSSGSGLAPRAGGTVQLFVQGLVQAPVTLLTHQGGRVTRTSSQTHCGATETRGNTGWFITGVKYARQRHLLTKRNKLLIDKKVFNRKQQD